MAVQILNCGADLVCGVSRPNKFQPNKFHASKFNPSKCLRLSRRRRGKTIQSHTLDAPCPAHHFGAETTSWCQIFASQRQ